MSNTKEFYGARTAYYAARTMEHSPTGIHDRCELASEAPATWGCPQRSAALRLRAGHQ